MSPITHETMMSAAEQCGRKLQQAMEAKIRSLHKQMEQLKRDSAVEKFEWEARQAVRQAAQARVEAVVAKLGI